MLADMVMTVSLKKLHFLLSHSLKASTKSSAEIKSSSMEAITAMIANQTDVALSLAKRLMSIEEKNRNFVFSPPSIHVMLSLLAAGSSGQTLSELLLFLKSNRNELNYLATHLGEVILADGLSHGGPNISFVNGVWVDHTTQFKKEFRNVAEGAYKASIKGVDYFNKADEVIKQVNSWAEKETNGLITNIVDENSVNYATRIIFANAIYFKGVWAEKFYPSATNNLDFHLLNGTSVKAPFMTTWNNQFVAEFDGFKVLQLPYRQNEDKRQFSMSIFLPDKIDGLAALAEQLCIEPGFIHKHTPKTKVSVQNLLIPKFKISSNLKLGGVLSNLGLTSSFRLCKGFSEMVDSEDICVSDILHKSFIEVNEEGTEAAAVTVVTCVAVSLYEPRRINFVADHPFLFVIRENVSGVVLFIGHILDPVEG